MAKLPSRTQVLDVLEREDGPLHTREIAQRLGVDADANAGLLRMLDDLVYDGVLTARGQRFKLDRKGAARGGASAHESTRASSGKKGLPERQGPSRDRREGILTVNPRGFGFVASPTATGDDVFVPGESLGGAMHGDLVVVEIVARGSRGAEGTIVEVKKRGRPRVSGILRRKGRNAWIDPDDPRVRGPVVLTADIDRSGPEGNSGRDGQVVVVEITQFPSEPGENPEGKILAVLGAPGELSVEVAKVLFIAQVEEVHSSAAAEEAEAFGTEVPASMLEGREDLTKIPLPTIDPEDARDHDDAVWVERTDGGGYDVWVAIADVSSYVRPGTHIDAEAHKRGCSIYLPDRAIPMLPRALSSNLCSLLPDVIRLCLCVYAKLDASGNVLESRLIRGFMKSAAKLTYQGVARALGFSDQPARDPKADAMVSGLRVAAECSRLLRNKRMKRGALDFDLPEAVIKLDADGKPIQITKRTNDPGIKKAYALIEDLMIFANEVVARWLLHNKLPGVYRVHLPPDPQKLEKLAAMCEMLGIDLSVDDTQTPKGLADILKRFADHPNAEVLNSLLLRSMKQATYDVSNLGHFGLASDAYLHFTSPIRRYPDLVVHRSTHAAIEKRSPPKLEDMAEAALHSSLAERRVMEVEREINDVYRCFYMIDHVGERFEARITSFVGSGAYATIEDPFVDVMIRVEDMGGDFQIEDDGLQATSRRSGEAIRLGDTMMVEIVDVAILRRAIYARRMRGPGDSGSARHEKRRGPPSRREGRGGSSRDEKAAGGPPGRRHHKKNVKQKIRDAKKKQGGGHRKKSKGGGHRKK